QALRDKNLYVQAAATAALGKIGEPAIEPLIQTLKNKDKDLQNATKRILTRIRIKKSKNDK
ncbi:unnamed protein product, partial [marine sediment metagenome]